MRVSLAEHWATRLSHLICVLALVRGLDAPSPPAAPRRVEVGALRQK